MTLHIYYLILVFNWNGLKASTHQGNQTKDLLQQSNAIYFGFDAQFRKVYDMSTQI